MAETRLDDCLLQDFMTSFYGYGTYEADFWFVGMEEGGAGSLEGIVEHFEHWDRRGRHELEDLRDFQVTKGSTDHFVGKRTLQRTWKGLARILLSLSDPEKETAVEEVRAFQAHSLGRYCGNNCLLELLPLPSPSTGHWLYADFSRLPFLADREAYRRHVVEWRATHIGNRIAEYQPAAVVFYSLNRWYMEWWKRITGVPLTELEILGNRTYLGRSPSTTFMIMKHTVAPGLSSEFFREVGQRLCDSSGDS